ncbi:unnamed protein product [Adineta steineri]|uniref:6-phosphogluconolactonase n=1 Tax=Adineta steineri TaxID=433720 RepID=A0A819K2N5_9BILA|nr:unnamed protein product [Adineta steineri]CAF3938906.1 unnamed protein product [Adineta steineri]
MSNQTFLVGTGIDSIYACSLTSTGQIELLNETKCGKASTWLLPRDDLLYIVNEQDDKIETFTIDDRNQGKLTLKNTISSKGDTPCALDFDPSGKWLAVANYGDKGASNFTFFPLNDCKQPEEKGAQTNTVEGSGPHPTRQQHSYCHHALFHQGYLYVVDLGTDTISVYHFNDTNGEVNLINNQIKTEAGAGPRHIIFHPTKPLAFVCNELNSTTNVYRVNSSSGELEYIQTIKTRRQDDENDSSKENYPAELQFTPDEKYLLVSNRGDENLVIFSLNENNEKEILSVKEHLDCHGSFTRYFTFDPTGKFLLIANQKSNNLVCFSYNRDNGTYTFISQLDNIQSPQHMVFLNKSIH